jgi:hypothetical protein
VVQRYRREVARRGESVGGRFVGRAVMIVTRRAAVHDGEGKKRDVCLATASANVFEDASYPVPIVVFSDRWVGPDHPYHPSASSNPLSSALG